MSDLLLNRHVFLFACVALTLLAGFGLQHWIRAQFSAPLDNSRLLFRELCRAHDLNSCQRRLLHRLALGLKLPSPSALLVDSSLWTIPEDGEAGNGLTKKEWDKLMLLRRVLFQPPAMRPF
ncbi:MAG: hypothetical protein ACTHOU_03955 [Aureliella sp.]|jgi:hypothetical protein